MFQNPCGCSLLTGLFKGKRARRTFVREIIGYMNKRLPGKPVTVLEEMSSHREKYNINTNI